MDDHRFDSLVKALAEGKSRRSVLKGLLGLGGAAVVGGTLLDGDSEAARRPSSTPTPRPTCPGQQIWNGSTCVCPASAPSKCGPDCCNPAGIGAAHSECCDNACCFGLCYGEELCCPTGRTFCEATGECCPVDQPYCCGVAGCCATPCCTTTAGIACCEGSTPQCCPGDICIAAGGCCSDRDCGEGTCFSCVNHVCVDDQSKCAGCLDCRGGTCVTNDQNCADTDPCTRSTCTADGSCTPQVFDCHLSAACCDDGQACTANICNDDGACAHPFDCRLGAGCCTPSDACHVATCNQDTGQCVQTEQCSAACCAAINPDEGCLSNPRCTAEGEGEDAGATAQIGICFYDVFCQDNCCATYLEDEEFTCATEGTLAGRCVVPF